MAKSKTAKQQVLTLLLLKGNYYPSDNADYDLLKRRNVCIYRIPSGSLPQLKATALNHLDIQVKPFSELWEEFVPSLEENFATLGTLHVVSQHEFWVKAADNRAAEIDKYLEKVSRFVQRYCIRVVTDVSKKQEFVRYKIKFVYAEEIDNSYAFVNENLTGPSITVPLTTCLRMVFTQRIVEGMPSITVQVQDKLGLDWSDCLNRTGRMSNIPKEDLAKLGAYFLNLS